MPMIRKLVYVISVFFTEDSGLEGNDTYFADSLADIDRVKAQIYEDYNDWEISEIIVSDEPEEREFYVA